jgi:hypothetical protein
MQRGPANGSCEAGAGERTPSSVSTVIMRGDLRFGETLLVSASAGSPATTEPVSIRWMTTSTKSGSQRRLPCAERRIIDLQVEDQALSTGHCVDPRPARHRRSLR